MNEPQKMACRWFHRWTAWNDIFTGREGLDIDKPGRGYPVLIQERRCILCNEVQRVTRRS